MASFHVEIKNTFLTVKESDVRMKRSYTTCLSFLSAATVSPASSSNSSGKSSCLSIEESNETRTTMIIRNMPLHYSQQDLESDIAEFRETYHFISFPESKCFWRNRGFCFIVFNSPQEALEFQACFMGFSVPMKKKVEMEWSQMQGRAAFTRSA